MGHLMLPLLLITALGLDLVLASDWKDKVGEMERTGGCCVEIDDAASLQKYLIPILRAGPNNQARQGTDVL